MSNPIDNRRLFLAALLSLGILILWQRLFPPARPVASGDPRIEQTMAEDSNLSGSTTRSSSGEGLAERRERGALDERDPREESEQAVERPLIVASTEQEVELETDAFVARFSNRGGQLVSFKLLDYRAAEEPLELVRARKEAPYPFAWVSPSGDPLALNGELFEVQRPDRSTVRFRYSGPEGVAEKSFRLLDEGFFEYSMSLRGGGDWATWLGPGIRNPEAHELEDRYQKRTRRVSFVVGDEMGDFEASKIDAPMLLPLNGLEWVALEDKYFLSAMVVDTPLSQVVARPMVNRVVDDQLVGFEPLSGGATGGEEDLPRDLALVLTPAGNELSGKAYWGAKEYVALKAKPYGFERTLRWGPFGFIAKPLLYGLRWLHANVVANYGWCIILMTLVIKIALFPLTHKSYISMQRLQKLNPRMEAIRHRYRPKLKDKHGRPNLEMQRKMNEEIQGLFREEGVSPAGGCLPILLQMPIFFGFYRLLSQTVELWNAPWIAWIHDLTASDPLYIMPLVMGATQLAQTKMMPPATNPSQRIIMTTMPIWFTVLAFGFPSGLVLYWLTNNVLTIVQQDGYKRLKKAGFFGGPEEETKPTGGKTGMKKKGKVGKVDV